MKKQFILVLLSLMSLFTFSQDISEKLNSLSKIYNFDFKELQSDTFYLKKYVLYVNQPIDHRDHDKGSFTQRVFLSHLGFDKPMIFITEGYASNYAENPRFISELSGLLNANQVCIEHRYFGESVTDELDWKYLTTYNAASDHHEIVEILKNIYNTKWISTGISKGGQTAMFHRYFYPEDVNITVGYVCPLNFSLEDKRVYRFLDNVGDSASREKILDYQLTMLENKTQYLPEFKKLAKKKKLSYRMSLEQAYELTILEYSFAYWQWGSFASASIPVPAKTAEIMVKHLDMVASIDWISNEGIQRMQPFFYQAITEIGFYGYDISAFENKVSFKENPTFDFTAPEKTEIIYNYEIMQEVDNFIRHDAENMIFIYGENDPWSSTAVDLTYNNNLVKIVKPGGSHLTRIRNLPENEYKLVMQTLNDWLDH